MRPIAVIGNLSRDVVEGGRPRVGGAPYYAGRALRLLGRRARIITKCAETDRAALLPPVVGLGHPVAWRASASTAAFSFAYRGDARVMHVDAVGAAWEPDEARTWVRAELGGAEWIHVAPLARTDFPPETLRVLARGRRLALDGQGLVRRGRTGPLELDRAFDPSLLEHVSILKLAEDEAVALLGEVSAASVRVLGVPEVLVTLGSRGSLVWSGGELVEVPVRRLARAVDPTGAGDAYAAAYVASRSGGLAPVAAARRATDAVVALLTGRGR